MQYTRFSDKDVKCYRMVKVHLGPGISVRGLMCSQVLQGERWHHAHEPGCSVEELSVERTSMFRRLRSRLYVTKGARGKMSRVCRSVDRMRKFWIRYRLIWVLKGWYVRTTGTLSTVLSTRSDPLRASGRRMVVTLRRWFSLVSEWVQVRMMINRRFTSS